MNGRIPRGAILFGATALSLALSAGPALGAGDAALETLLAQKSPSIVSVKFVMKMRFGRPGGPMQEQEANREVHGVVVDSAGLVLLANESLEGVPPNLKRMIRRQGAEVTGSPSDLKVLFGSDSKEYEAVVVARDSNLGLAYVQITDPEAKSPSAVDLSKDVEIGVGQTLLTVSRKGRGFDCAPVLGRLFVSGKVDKPRTLWSVAGVGAPVGLPAFDTAGAAVGILTTQQGAAGVEEDDPFAGGGAAEVFLLPLDAVRRSLEQAKKRVPEAVAKAKEAKETKEPAPTAPSPSMDEPAMDGDKPADTPKAPPTPEAPMGPDTPK